MGRVLLLRAPIGRAGVALALLSVAFTPRAARAQGEGARLDGPVATPGQPIRHRLSAQVALVTRVDTPGWRSESAGARVTWYQTVRARANAPVVLWLATPAAAPPELAEGWTVRTVEGWRPWGGEPVAVSGVVGPGTAGLEVALRPPPGMATVPSVALELRAATP
jgi:hypothetical protein